MGACTQRLVSSLLGVATGEGAAFRCPKGALALFSSSAVSAKNSSPSYADVSRRGAAPHLPAPARVTRSVTAVAPSAPPAGVACAAPPPPQEGQQTPAPAGPKAAASAVRPEAAANVPAVQAPSTTSEEMK
ncbi:testis-specific gene A8 protein-like [Rhipicephalus sanguineus]|uniref:testis-specific gene A8 protein-like n=1 Tax=Rhipicephalus sanguineus TaxID=34632 RepID=UPI0020C396C1|nr:testis-specific gene A8 protein-like [Rhipicephalus sanguineus]